MTADRATDEWKLAEITKQSYGPSYLIATDDDQLFADTVRFNEFQLGVDGRVEVESVELRLTDDSGRTGPVADFYDERGAAMLAEDTSQRPPAQGHADGGRR